MYSLEIYDITFIFTAKVNMKEYGNIVLFPERLDVKGLQLPKGYDIHQG